MLAVAGLSRQFCWSPLGPSWGWSHLVIGQGKFWWPDFWHCLLAGLPSSWSLMSKKTAWVSSKHEFSTVVFPLFFFGGGGGSLPGLSQFPPLFDSMLTIKYLCVCVCGVSMGFFPIPPDSQPHCLESGNHRSMLCVLHVLQCRLYRQAGSGSFGPHLVPME